MACIEYMHVRYRVRVIGASRLLGAIPEAFGCRDANQNGLLFNDLIKKCLRFV
jgi:hypothetical protein